MRGKGITKTPGVCGGEACIAETRIAIWLLVEAQQLGISEAQLLQDYPHITAADLVNAWAYPSFVTFRDKRIAKTGFSHQENKQKIDS